MEHTKDSCRLWVRTDIQDDYYSVIVTYHQLPQAVILMAMGGASDRIESRQLADSAVIQFLEQVSDMAGIIIESCTNCKDYFIDGEGILDMCSMDCGETFHGFYRWHAMLSEASKTL